MPKLDNRQDAEIVPNADISTADEVIAQAEIPGDRLVSINIESTADASYAIDVAASYVSETANWFEDEVTYDKADEDDPQDIRDVFELGDRHMRIRVTDAAADGETADVTIQVA